MAAIASPHFFFLSSSFMSWRIHYMTLIPFSSRPSLKASSTRHPLFKETPPEEERTSSSTRSDHSCLRFPHTKGNMKYNACSWGSFGGRLIMVFTLTKILQGSLEARAKRLLHTYIHTHIHKVEPYIHKHKSLYIFYSEVSPA